MPDRKLPLSPELVALFAMLVSLPALSIDLIFPAMSMFGEELGSGGDNQA